MSVLSMVAGALRLERKPVEVVVVEPKPVEKTEVEWYAAFMYAEGCDREEIAEFLRKNQK